MIQSRRDLLRCLMFLPGIPVLAQDMITAKRKQFIAFDTYKATGYTFAPTTVTKTGAVLTWDFGDGSWSYGNLPSHAYAGGVTNRITMVSPDGWTGLTVFDVHSQNLVGTLPSFASCTALVHFYCYYNSFSGILPSFSACMAMVHFYCGGNSFSGTLPSFATCTALQNFDCGNNSFSGTLPSFSACTALVSFNGPSNAFSGTLPSFSGCTALQYFYCHSNGFSGTLPSFSACTALQYFYCNYNSFSGTLPSFAACTALQYFYCHYNSFSGTLPSFSACTALVDFYGYHNSFSAVTPGSFATQKSMAMCDLSVNALPAAEVNQVLADLVASLGGGRVICTVNLSGGTNEAPTGQGLVDKATLIAAGWTVTTT